MIYARRGGSALGEKSGNSGKACSPVESQEVQQYVVIYGRAVHVWVLDITALWSNVLW